MTVQDSISDDDDERAGDEDVSRGRTGRVAFARINSLTLHGHLPEELRKALVPGTRLEHYQREWILGQVVDEEDVIFGKLGFERMATGSRFDTEAQDFVTQQREDGTYSLFAIDVNGLRVAFQTRGQTIKPQSFVGALQALLNTASPTERWRVEHDRTEEQFASWLGRVRRIERVKVRVERPNPNYHGRDKVESIIEGLNAEVAELSAKADPDDPQGLDRQDDLLQQLVGHADRYGSVDARGEDDEGQRVEYHSGRKTDEVEVEVDPKTRDVSRETLREHLKPQEDG